MIRALAARLKTLTAVAGAMTVWPWLRGAALGAALYLLVLAALFFIFVQQQSSFIYAGF